MRALIVDDESSARSILKHYLKDLDNEIEIVAEANSVPEAVKAVHAHNPELVFLDIEMPGQDGFALFDYLDEPNFQVIFVTASRDFALDAFRVSALDYILKPIDSEQLQQAIHKASQQRQAELKKQVQMFDEQMHSENQEVKTLVLSTNESIDFIKTEQIIYLKADGGYTEFILDDEKHIVVSKSLGEYQMLENQPIFFKTHRSYIVNLLKVVQYKKEDGGMIVMQNGDDVAISRYRKDTFLEEMGKI